MSVRPLFAATPARSSQALDSQSAVPSGDAARNGVGELCEGDEARGALPLAGLRIVPGVGHPDGADPDKEAVTATLRVGALADNEVAGRDLRDGRTSSRCVDGREPPAVTGCGLGTLPRELGVVGNVGNLEVRVGGVVASEPQPPVHRDDLEVGGAWRVYRCPRRRVWVRVCPVPTGTAEGRLDGGPGGAVRDVELRLDLLLGPLGTAAEDRTEVDVEVDNHGIHGRQWWTLNGVSTRGLP